ncbi:hypothetical protein CBM2589_A90449 [Cupriavidus taiwanensis]|uniref:Uncharacterized protein n=1 Tax=Cupriavidus taiwanensis TaxID=164546 RepID=A0A975XG81_9BURK|nr:hypothetical protein CBM2589_A90449 [Cupriavidus taiwanensis]
MEIIYSHMIVFLNCINPLPLTRLAFTSLLVI